MEDILIHTYHNGDSHLRGKFNPETKVFKRPDCPLFIGHCVFIEEDVYNKLVELGCVQTLIGTRATEAAKGVTCNPTMAEWGKASRFMWGGSAAKPLNDRMILFLYWKDVVGSEPVPEGAPLREISPVRNPRESYSKRTFSKPKPKLAEVGHE